MNWIDAPRYQSGRTQGCAPIDIGVPGTIKHETLLHFFVKGFFIL